MKFDEAACAWAWAAWLGGGARGEGGGFDGDEPAHHRFTDAQPREQQRLGFARQRVMLGDVIGAA